MSFPRFVARSMLASMFITGGFNAAKNAEAIAPATDALFASLPREVTDVLPDISGAELTKISGVTMTVAGSALALGVFPRVAALVLAAQLLPTTLAGHRFWEKEGSEKIGERIAFQKNLALAGGLLLVSLDGARKSRKTK
ncbi:MAG: DoxX family protein [Propionibacterium sp.]